ncbi:hypothetical protein ACFL4G_09650, partial [Thermodesulfobacteriota bacterium]
MAGDKALRQASWSLFDSIWIAVTIGVIAAVYYQAMDIFFLADDALPFSRVLDSTRFVPTFSARALRHLVGLDNFYYHLFGLCFHAASSVLLYVFILFLTGNRALAALESLLFCVFLGHDEAVIWTIGGLHDLQTTTFYMASILLFCAFLRRRRTLYYLASLVAYTLALYSKQMASTLIVMLLLCDLLFTRNDEARPGLVRRTALRAVKFIPFIAVFLVYFIQNRGEMFNPGFRNLGESAGSLPFVVEVVFSTLGKGVSDLVWQATTVPGDLLSPGLCGAAIAVLLAVGLMLGIRRVPWRLLLFMLTSFAEAVAKAVPS